MSDLATNRGELEQERDFLLRSLDDLEAERAVGGVDEASYQELHDDYTARAAAVIRALRDGIDSRPSTPGPAATRRAVVVAGIVGFGVLAGVALAAALGARLPGETSSGNSGGTTSATLALSSRIERLERAVTADPGNVASRMLLARLLEEAGDVRGALEQYDTVLGIDAGNAEAEAQGGRILYLTAQAAVQTNSNQTAALVDRARARFDHAVELDPEYPDVRFFRAVVLAQEYQEFAAAQNDLQRYLLLAPNGPYAVQVRALLAQVTDALDNK